MKTLDVGCGGSAQVFYSISEADYTCDVAKPCVKLSNFVQCDVQHLPYREDIFDKVVAHQVIEHCDNPFRALTELIRVSKFLIEVAVPHRFYWQHSRREHKHTFNRKWFIKTLGKLGYKYWADYVWGESKTETEPRCFPHPLFCLIQLPTIITVKIRKNSCSAARDCTTAFG